VADIIIKGYKYELRDEDGDLVIELYVGEKR